MTNISFCFNSATYHEKARRWSVNVKHRSNPIFAVTIITGDIERNA